MAYNMTRCRFQLVHWLPYFTSTSFHPTGCYSACIVVTMLYSRQRVFSRVIQWTLCYFVSPFNKVSKLLSELVLFYLDDGTIAVSLQDLRLIEVKLDLELNNSKSELIHDQHSLQEAMLSEVPDHCTISCSQATFLGSSIGDIECISTYILMEIDWSICNSVFSYSALHRSKSTLFSFLPFTVF